MKKDMAIVILMMVILGTANAAGSLDYWDEKTIIWLEEDTNDFLMETDREEYTSGNIVKNDLALGYCVLTKEDTVFYDATPRTIASYEFQERIETLLKTTVHSIDSVYIGQRSGYEIYEIVIKWNTPVTTFGNYGKCYGLDFFMRFYN